MPRLRFSAITVALFIAFAGGAGASARAETVALVIDAPLKGPAKLALADFEAALAKRKIDVVRQAAIASEGLQIVVGTLRDSANIRAFNAQFAATRSLGLAETPEALWTGKTYFADSEDEIILAGFDDRGLSYALLEAARAVELAPPQHPLGDFLGTPANESPALAVRSVSVHPMNADLEAEWYYSEEYWRGYFKMLAQNRFNRFLLTFSDQTNYLCPLYAYTVEVPEYPNVRVRGLDAVGKKRNLDMLRRISDMAAERGLDFTLAIWMQSPVPRYSGEVKVEGLPEGLAGADYCARGLRAILDHCPAIGGVQFRLNSEAGVKEEEQTEFYRPLFKAIADCGRPMRLDLRYKGLQESTIAAARELKLDLTVSTKFWAEHFGLPYHPTEVDKHYRKDRYSFGSLLKKPRDYRVVYQLWTAGSMRIFPWGDPAYVKQFVESCKLGDGEGFEVFAPLTNKGYGDAPGNWRLLKNPADEWYRWEYERYWCFYLSFGRFAYSPDYSIKNALGFCIELPDREYIDRLGNSGTALAHASIDAAGILPLITAAHLPSASEWGYWPEMETGGRLEEYSRAQPSDTGMFYAISNWKKTSNWAWEDWDDSIPGYVEDAVRGRLNGKVTPMQVSQRLLAMADGIVTWVDFDEKDEPQPTVVVRDLRRDLRILAELARYHAYKTRAAVDLAFFQLGERDPARPARAADNMDRAVEAWKAIIRLTDGVYAENLVFGITPDSPRSTLGRHHSGHWRDRLPELLDDVAYLEQLLKTNGGRPTNLVPAKTYPGEDGIVPELTVGSQSILFAIAGRDLPVEINVESKVPVVEVLLHYRRLDQTAGWNVLPMTMTAAERYEATIPGEAITADWDLQYFVEVLTPTGGVRWLYADFPPKRSLPSNALCSPWQAPYWVVTTVSESAK